jgi:hypothetical protein
MGKRIKGYPPWDFGPAGICCVVFFLHVSPSFMGLGPFLPSNCATFICQNHKKYTYFPFPMFVCLFGIFYNGCFGFIPSNLYTNLHGKRDTLHPFFNFIRHFWKRPRTSLDNEETKSKRIKIKSPLNPYKKFHQYNQYFMAKLFPP